MAGFLASLWSGLTGLVGLVLPFFGMARTLWGFGTFVRWTIHVVLVIALVVGLYFLNNTLGMQRLIPVSPPFRFIANAWLPILFLLMYVFSWLAWWLWKLLSGEVSDTAFPDIDAAWEEGLRALGNAGIDVTNVPLFLVLGQPRGSDAVLLRGAQLRLIVSQTPSWPGAPLHVYANHEAIYVTCPGASLLGKEAELLAAGGDNGEDTELLAMLSNGEPTADDDDPFVTNRPNAQNRVIVDILRRAHAEKRELTEEEKLQTRALANLPARKQRPSVLRSKAMTEDLTARLQHLCGLIVRDRRPYCPVNGILVLVPFGGTDSDDDAGQFAEICQRDLSTARRTFQVCCPAFALVCDLETCAGVDTFVDTLPVADRKRRVGQRFPLTPDVDEENHMDAIDSSVHWVCHSYFPNWVYGLFRLESAPNDDPAKMVATNVAMYQMLGQLRDRQKRLSRILKSALSGNGQPYFGGCYFAGTGEDAVFLPGVFRRLVESQNYVSWTDDALAQDSDQERWTWWGYIVLGSILAAVVAGLAYHFFGPSARG